MIKYLNGIKETVDFDEMPTFLLYDNIEDEEYPSHWHAPLEIVMPLTNDYTISCEGIPYTLKEEELIIISPGVVHKCHASSGRRLIFQAALSKFANFSDFGSKFGNLKPSIVVSRDSNSEIHAECVSIMHDIMNEYFSEDVAREYAIASDVLRLLCLIFRTSSFQPKAASNASKQHLNVEIFDQIRDYTLAHCTENITLDEIAERSGFSKYYFTRAFKDYSGTSYYKFLNICRINYSTELLIDPEISITEVAINSGFNTISSFIRMFKQIKGCTPTDYRKMHEMLQYD